MRADESKCRYQTMSLFSEAPVVKPPPVKTTGQVEIFFDGGCLGNPGQKYGSFQGVIRREIGGQPEPGRVRARHQ